MKCARTCYAPEWCQQTEACAIEVRLRWRKGRRTKFKGWVYEKPALRKKETVSQYEARVRGDD